MSEYKCQNLKEELQEIKDLKSRFDVALEDSVKSGRAETASALKQQLVERARLLKEKIWPFENLSRLELKRQYDDQARVLVSTGVVEQLPNGRLGIIGIDGNKYPLPEFETVAEALKEAKEKVERKNKQGFTQVLLVPFGLSLDTLADRYKETILSHHRSGTLFATKRDSSESNSSLQLNEKQPFYVWDKYVGADKNEKLVYDPQSFDSSHNGRTKQDILNQNTHSKTPGWQIILIEDLPNIPRQGQGTIVGDRPQLDTAGSGQVEIATGQSVPCPREYLKALRENPLYTDEFGMTPEQWLIYAIAHLELTNQVIDDWQGNGSVAYLLGAYFPAAEYVPDACWNRDVRQACLGRDDPGGRNDSVGARSAVRVT